MGSILITILHAYGANALAYRVIFATATFFLVLAAVLVLFVREKPSLSSVAPQATPAPLKETPATHHDRRRRIAAGWKLAFRTHAGKPQGFLLFWPVWENFLRKLWHIQSIPDSPYQLLQVRFVSYHGQPIDLPGDVHIQKGDPVIELHFRNHAFLEIGEHVETWKYMAIIAQNLRALAHWMQSPNFPGDAKAMYGVTLLSRGAPWLGFTLRQRPKTLLAWFDRFFMMGLLVLYNPMGEERLRQGSTYGSYPQEAWMSRDALLERYL